jgi:hypothetical protein
MALWQDRRLWALFANAAYALSSFVLGYLLLLQGSQNQYGAFAFYLLLQAFGYSLINALFGAPLLIAARDGTVAAGGLNPMLRLALLLALLGAAVQALLFLQQGIAADVIVLLALSAALLLLRWFCRCVQQNDAPEQVMLADLSFSLVALPGSALLWQQGLVSLWSLSQLLLLAAIVSLLPAGRLLWTVIQAEPDGRLWSAGYAQQGKPALAGVVTVEVTANFHQYVLMLLQGAAALAPVAAAGLFLRPMTLVQSSLAQIERPRLARAVAAADWPGLQRIWRSFLWLSAWAFLLNLLAILILLWLAPAWLWPDLLTLPHFIACGGFVALAALLRSLRGPASTLLQAFDQFHFLASVTWRASLATVPLVLLGLYAGGIYGALLAMLLGECAVAIPILRQCRQTLQTQAGFFGR